MLAGTAHWQIEPTPARLGEGGSPLCGKRPLSPSTHSLLLPVTAAALGRGVSPHTPDAQHMVHCIHTPVPNSLAVDAPMLSARSTVSPAYPQAHQISECIALSHGALPHLYQTLMPPLGGVSPPGYGFPAASPRGPPSTCMHILPTRVSRVGGQRLDIGRPDVGLAHLREQKCVCQPCFVGLELDHHRRPARAKADHL